MKPVRTWLDTLREIVNGEGTWQDKRDAIWSECSDDDDRSNLEEFAGWFAVEE